MQEDQPVKDGYGRKQRLLLRVERISRRHYRAVFLVALLAVLIAGWLGSRLHLESDFLRLFPEGNGKVDVFRAALEEFGSIDYLLALVEIDDASELEDMEDFADIFAERLEAESDLVEGVEYRLQLDDRFLELFYENALLFLPPDRLPELASRLTDERIHSQIQQDRLQLSSPTAGLAEGLLLNDPLGLTPLFLNRILGNRGALNVDLSDGYYLSRDSLKLIMLVKPTGSSHDLQFDRDLLEATRRAAAESRAELESEFEGESLNVRVRYGGHYAMALEEAGLIRKDVKRNIWISLLAVSGLYWLCYRRFAALLYATDPLSWIGAGADVRPGVFRPEGAERRLFRVHGALDGTGSRFHHRHVRPVRGGAPEGVEPGPGDRGEWWGRPGLGGFHRGDHFGRYLLRSLHQAVSGGCSISGS